MCRLAAYFGPPIPLRQFLLEPSHNLVEQAWQPREMHYAKLNADGFGFGWYNLESTPSIYRNSSPIWADENLPHLAGSMEGNLWLANVRSATQGSPITQSNTQPFCDTELLFMHNGYLEDFSNRTRFVIESHLEPEFKATIGGNTDSEFIFALLRQLYTHQPEADIETVLMALLERLEEWLGNTEALLNIIVTEGQRLVAARYALNHECPSLYYTTSDEAYPQAQLIASEPMTESTHWQEVPEHHVLILEPEHTPELIAL